MEERIEGNDIDSRRRNSGEIFMSGILVLWALNSLTFNITNKAEAIIAKKVQKYLKICRLGLTLPLLKVSEFHNQLPKRPSTQVSLLGLTVIAARAQTKS